MLREPTSLPPAAGDDLPARCRPIEVRVAELRQLFDEIDPSPFQERDLDPKAAAFIVEWSGDLPASAPLALVVLAASIGVGDALAMSSPDSHVIAVLREGLLIVGWVAMWRPLEVFLYDWWPIRAEARLFDRLSAMTVRIKPSRSS